MAKKGTSPRARLRALLMELYQLRGSAKAGLWLLYSSKNDRDLGVVGDLEYLHAIWLEARRDVVSYRLQSDPQIVKIGSDDHMTKFDAIAQMKSGATEAHEVKPVDEERNPQDLRTLHQRDAQVVAAEQLGATRRVITDEVLAEHEQLIFNWIRASAWIDAARDHPIQEFETYAGLRLTGRDTTVGALQEEITPDDWPLFLPAIFRLYQRGRIESDLAEKPLSRSTRFWSAT